MASSIFVSQTKKTRPLVGEPIHNVRIYHSAHQDIILLLSLYFCIYNKEKISILLVIFTLDILSSFCFAGDFLSQQAYSPLSYTHTPIPLTLHNHTYDLHKHTHPTTDHRYDDQHQQFSLPDLQEYHQYSTQRYGKKIVL